MGRLRPEYVASLGLQDESAGRGEKTVDAIRAGDDFKRDVKVALSIPVIAACGVGLGLVLSGIFVLEAFVAQVYEGFGKGVVVSCILKGKRQLRIVSPLCRLRCLPWLFPKSLAPTTVLRSSW